MITAIVQRELTLRTVKARLHAERDKEALGVSSDIPFKEVIARWQDHETGTVRRGIAKIDLWRTMYALPLPDRNEGEYHSD